MLYDCRLSLRTHCLIQSLTTIGYYTSQTTEDKVKPGNMDGSDVDIRHIFIEKRQKIKSYLLT